MKKLIVANLKMNFTQEEVKAYIKKLLQFKVDDNNQVVIIPSYTCLPVANQMLFGKHLMLGAQDVSDKEKGAFTGEVSALMLKELDISYVLVGHSERRKHFLEKNKTINQKIKVLLKYGIRPILCIGETERERKQNKTGQVLKTQLEQGLNGIYENELNSIVIAYEPVWAIGTKNSASVKDVLAAVKQIRGVIKQLYSEKAAQKLLVLYGGSISAENSKNYLQQKDINGTLVGGASLNPEEFASIFSE